MDPIAWLDQVVEGWLQGKGLSWLPFAVVGLCIVAYTIGRKKRE